MREINKKLGKPLAEALMTVGELQGVHSPHCPDDEIGVKAGYFDNYLLVHYLGQLIERGELTIKIAPEREDYLKKLLHIETQ